MKKIISLLLTFILVCSTFLLQTGTINAEENTNNMTTKEAISQNYYEIYGENGIIDDSKEYTWNYEEVEEDEGILSDPNISLFWPINDAGDPDKIITHNEIIDSANEIAIESGVDWIPSTYLPLVKYISRRCDSSRNDTVGNLAEYNSKVIHGQENYFATLYYLWTFARSIKNYESGSITDAVQTANQAGRAVLPIEIKQKDKYEKLFHFTKQIVKDYYNDTTTCYETGQTLGRRCKYIVYGIICHTLGDIYSHRTVIPKNAVNTLLESGTDMVVYDSENANHERKYFIPEDFEKLDRSGTLTDNILNLKDMIEIVKAGQNYELKEDGTLDEKSVGIQEMREYFILKSSVKNGLNDDQARVLLESIKDSMGSKYIDNGKFYPGRVDEAVWAIDYFISYFSNCNPTLVIDTISPVNFNLKGLEIYKTSFYVQ